MAPIDLTNSVLSYQWSKTIKAPGSQCTISIIPQRSDINIMDDLNPMDVIQIYEFGALKYTGYIRTIKFSGQITEGTPGRPLRVGSIIVSGFGELIATASLGINLGNFKKNFQQFFASAQELAVALNKVTMDSTSTYADFITTAYVSWTTLIQNIGASDFAAYLGSFVDIGSSLDNELSPSFPRSVYLWTGTESSITFWQALFPALQFPFNEMWFDNGPRTLYLNSGTQSNVQLQGYGTTYGVFRATPFDGTVHNGTSSDLFKSLPVKVIPKSSTLRFDFTKTSDESYTVYNCVTPVMSLNTQTRAALGLLEADPVNLNKYLLRMMTSQLYFSRQTSTGQQNTVAKTDPQAGAIEGVGGDLNQTLLNWYTNNDRYLSGGIVFNVPKDATQDVYIGERVQLEGIEGDFYAEGVAHQWTMLGPLLSTLSVTRGWNETNGSPITTTDAIFRSGIPTEEARTGG